MNSSKLPQRGDPLPLAQALIQCPSVTPEDHGCQDILIWRLEALGFTITKLRFGRILNFYAVRPILADSTETTTTTPNLCFAGHTDVVPAGDPKSWSADPFGAEVRDGWLIGRGACDMKGGLAAMVAAVERFLNDPPQGITGGSLSFLITGDEEADAVDGTAKVLEWMEQHDAIPDLCLVGEPTSAAILGDGVKSGRRGSVNGVITIKGVQGHVAYPQRANNPMHAALPALATLAAVRFDEGTADFEATRLQFTEMASGDATTTNVIPGEMRARFNIRFNTQHTPESLEARIRQALDAMTEDPDVRYDLEMNVSGLPFLSQEGQLLDALTQAVTSVTGKPPVRSTGGGTSDARFIARYCPQTVEFGLVGQTMHKVDEATKVDDLYGLTDIYHAFLTRVFTSGDSET
ncbi:MAG: succinyl-diaminopimelate desuccinylase [Magnetococcales bacterium]|nr:succinyl-diaminopimelate desuccinylase [Magnetococcales bacterium]